MKALSQSEYGDLRNLYESIYTPKVDLAEELLDEIFDELVDEYIEEGYSEEDAIEIVDEAIDIYIDESLCEASDSYYDSAVRASKKAAQGIDKAARQKRRAGQVRYAKRKAGEALNRAGDKVKGAVAGAQIAGSIAKDEARRAGRKAVHAVTSAPGKAKASVDRKKKGIKGFIKRQAQKVVDRMSEELEAIGFDAFDVVLEFLQVEGYAETLEEAEWIMANLIDEEAIDIVLGEDELDENRRMARDPEGRKSGHSKQPDPSKPGFTGMGNMSIDQIRKMSARIEKEKTKKEEFEAWFDEVLEAYKEPNLDKMRKQEYRHSKAAVKQRGGSRGSSKNRAFKMSSIRDTLERGEDPRADSYGGKRTKYPQDHRASFSKNPLNNPPRRVKKPGV